MTVIAENPDCCAPPRQRFRLWAWLMALTAARDAECETAPRKRASSREPVPPRLREDVGLVRVEARAEWWRLR